MEMNSRFCGIFVSFLLVNAGFVLKTQGSDRVVGFERAIYIPGMKPFWKYLSSFDNTCLGVLLTPSDVLTTCDCLTEVKGIDQRLPSFSTEIQRGMRVLSPSILRIKTHEVSRGESEFINTTEVKIHPKCDGVGSYDYGMARLKTPVQSVEIRLTENYFPYSEAVKHSYPPDGDEPQCYISTFINEVHEWNEPPKTVSYPDTGMIPVTVADAEECREFFDFNPNYVHFDWGHKICVEANTLAPICQGDVGVPLVCNETLVGIVTSNSVFCEWNSALNVVSSVADAWDFIEHFIKSGGIQYWKNKAREVLSSIKGLTW